MPEGKSASSIQIDPELDEFLQESLEARDRRLMWIRYHLRNNGFQEAFDLGWDGTPWEDAPLESPPSPPRLAATPAKAVVQTEL